MKVLLCARSYYLADSSGETETIYNIYSYLKRNNIDASICGANEEIDYGKYDIVHIFDIKNIFDAYKHFRLAAGKRCSIVLSPMYYDMKQYLSKSGDEARANIWRSCSVYRNIIVNKSDFIICSSRYEAELIKKDFSPKGEVAVIKSGVDACDSEVPLYNFMDRYNIDNYVLCVGRICKIKNQLLLSKACSELNIPLVLIGKQEDLKYLRQCIQNKTTKYLGYMNEYDLQNAYSFCSLYVMPGYTDITGLSVLKAASYGCNVVASEQSVVKEYLGYRISYCNPYSYESIKNSVKENFKNHKDDSLKRYVTKNHSIEKSMKEVYSCYEKIIARDAKRKSEISI